ncbi:hypothetical protein EMIT0215P_70157 [Pseudomonas serboccidentalis]
MLARVMGQVNDADGALMILAQGFTQHAEQWPQPGAGRQQPQRSRVPVRVVMQRPATQFAKADRVADLQAPRRIAEFAGLATVEVEFEKAVFLRQARQRIRPGDVIDPQHQMLPGAVAQRSLRGQAQAQHVVAEPVQRFDQRRPTVRDRVEGVHLQVFSHLTLTRQAPALLTLLGTQGIWPIVRRQAAHALHQTRMATARATAVRHRDAVLIQGIEQVAARCH